MQTRNTQDKDPYAIDDLILHNHALQYFCLKTAQFKLANTILTQTLAHPLKNYCFVCHIDHGMISIGTNSAIWATQLRYHQHELLIAFQKEPEFHSIQRINIRISLPKEKPPATKQRTITMSSATSQLILDTAKSIKNTELKAALQKLANNGLTHFSKGL
jgi:hypothetical protein